MKPQAHELTGILLAGGMSTRMGKEKGMLKVGSQPLYRYPMDVLEKMCQEILISTCRPTQFPESYPMVCDQYPGIGPMGGLCTCLDRSSTLWNVILSCDLPLVSTALISYLLDQTQGYDIVVPYMEEGKPEPLCAIYSRETIGIFKELIAHRTYAIHQALSMARTRFVAIDENLSFFRPDLFLNINRREDLRKIPDELWHGIHEE
jgi:molybdopterin-guanine dinucleotide biosynthesis protein A